MCIRDSPQELAAINWIKDNLSPKSTIVTSTSSRHPEWIPVLTNLNWLPVSSSNHYFNPIQEKYLNGHYNPLNPPKESDKYYAFFTNVEEVHEIVLNHPELFPIIYKNEAVTIVKTPLK